MRTPILPFKRRSPLDVPGQKAEVRHDVRLNRLTLAACAALLAGEVVVGIRLDQGIGILLVASTAILLVGLKSTQTLVARAQVTAEPAGEPRNTTTDGRTGLPNHQVLIDELGRELERNQHHGGSVVLACIEVERLGDIRAAWGSAAAEEAVLHTAAVLCRVARPSDVLASLGDGRFVALLTQCTASRGPQFADRVARAVTNRPLESRDQWRLPLFIGVSCNVLQFDRAQHGGVYGFLAAAGCDEPVRPASRQETSSRHRGAGSDHDPVAVRDYYSDDGPAPDFAQAYKEHRKQRAG